ncbi:MAG: hypothetical protein AAGA28_01015, partial [Pseudomonadota bacterium]
GMIGRRLFCLAFVFLANWGAAGSANPFVTCIQEQLAEAGIEAGPVDGLPGGKTRAGLAVLAQDHPLLGTLPPLTRDTAPMYCREVGLARDSRVGWSDPGQLIELVLGEDIDAENTALIEIIADEVTDFYLNEMGVVVSRTIPVVISRDAAWAGAAANPFMEEQGYSFDLKEVFTDWCSEKDMCGLSYGGVVMVSFSSIAAPEREMRDYIAHEVAHDIHNQYVGSVGGRGPRWLSEAAALAITLRYLQPHKPPKYQAKGYANRWDYSAARLKEFSAQRLFSGGGFYDYSTYAGLRLAEIAGVEAYFEFWDKTPELGWKEAFENAFGLSVEEFYDVFEEG